MNWLKKTISFIGILTTLLFVIKTNDIPDKKNVEEKSDAFFTDNLIHFSDFVQPQTSSHFIKGSKKNDIPFIKGFDSFFVLSQNFKTTKKKYVFLFQDINRCNKVSLLLFPFHIFW